MSAIVTGILRRFVRRWAAATVPDKTNTDGGNVYICLEVRRERDR